MMAYNFTLVLSGISQRSEDLDALEDAIFEAGCDDATLCFHNLIPYLEFDREATSFREAVISAIHQIETINDVIRVERIEPDDLVTASEIARRINKSREYIRLLIQGERGKGEFPLPISGMSNKSLLWSWVKVTQWLKQNQLIDDESVKIAQDIADFNHLLFYRKDESVFSRINTLNKLLSAA
ncbi:conserved hypothetical protein [Rippkaea orientalis PCC 8801]|uniref:DNA-binding protein n=1 Tax=Rippkaea orientalis (strain PCC 8801 / RF-1) TaxID=41431 RepID=B7JY17_RIPO1|nr:hypothetical protein [Rippkaea orientalis]ACK65981.1 conserved hypothetical protein [Rippkaea orientalis PCC 8801]